MTSAAPSDTATIMVVDDDPHVRSIVAEFLASSGYYVLEADGGREALRILADTPEVQLIITDVRMPDVSGLKLAEMAMRTRADLKVILISGYFVSRQVSLRVLKKPFRMQELAETVRGELGR
jgi:two-component system, cell cycle response regulator CpdR